MSGTVTGITFITVFLRYWFNEIHIGLYGSAIGAAGLTSLLGSWMAKRVGNYKKIVFVFYAAATMFFLMGISAGHFLFQRVPEVIPLVVLMFLLIWQLLLNMATPVLLSWLHNNTGNSGWQKFYSTRAIIGHVSCLISGLAVGAYLNGNNKMG